MDGTFCRTSAVAMTVRASGCTSAAGVHLDMKGVLWLLLCAELCSGRSWYQLLAGILATHPRAVSATSLYKTLHNAGIDLQAREHAGGCWLGVQSVVPGLQAPLEYAWLLQGKVRLQQCFCIAGFSMSAVLHHVGASVCNPWRYSVAVLSYCALCPRTLNRSSRVMPGLRGTPAGMITRSQPFRASSRAPSPS